MKKIFLILGLCAVVIVGGFFVLNTYIYNEKQATVEEMEKSYEPYRATLQGEFVCIPHVDGAIQTKECAHGIKTDAGEYYAVDMNPMSQTPPQLRVGERFTASGVITPIERVSTDHWQKYPIIGIFSVTDSLVLETTEHEVFECDGDAKVCPDGSAVGRSGPACEFTACPSPDATSAETTTYLGGTVTALNMSVSPKEIISDSRCPIEVTCVWAGTVEVRTTLSTPVSHGEHVLALGTPQVFGAYTVTLIGVTPEKTEEAIPGSSYRFTFEIIKN
jgi:hypothetical protein